MVRQVQFEKCHVCGEHGYIVLRSEPLFLPHRCPVFSVANGLERLHDLAEENLVNQDEGVFLKQEIQRANLPLETEDRTLENKTLMGMWFFDYIQLRHVPYCYRQLLN